MSNLRDPGVESFVFTDNLGIPFKVAGMFGHNGEEPVEWLFYWSHFQKWAPLRPTKELDDWILDQTTLPVEQADLYDEISARHS